MRTLAEQVSAYLEAEGLSSSAFAKLVKVSRQNIDNVLAGNVQSPRYLPDIARAMGTTVEVLAAGRFRYGAQPVTQDAGPSTLEERQHLEMFRGLSDPARQLLTAYLHKLRAMDAASADDLETPRAARATGPSRKRSASGG